MIHIRYTGNNKTTGMRGKELFKHRKENFLGLALPRHNVIVYNSFTCIFKNARCLEPSNSIELLLGFVWD